MKERTLVDKDFNNLQNKFRGLVSKFKSPRSFSKELKESEPSSKFRSGLRRLFLDARIVLPPPQFDVFLAWIDYQMRTGVGTLAFQKVGYGDLSGIYSKAPIVSLERELLWITARIRTDADKLNAFRSGTEEIEQLVFGGEIEEAIQSLVLIERAFGASLWSVQLRIALENFAGGLERQKKYTAEVRGIYKSGLLGFFAYHTSVRNEERSTFTKYCDDIRARIDKHQYFSPHVKVYARYRLAGEFPANVGGLADILRVEQSHSFIDVYETFVAVAQEIARREDLGVARGVMVKCLRSLTAVDDFRLAKTAYYLDGQHCGTFPQRSKEISDLLFSGDIKRAALISRRVLKSHTDTWQHIYAGVALSHTTRSRSPRTQTPKQIQRLIGAILSRTESIGDSIAQLEKTATNLRGLPTAAGLLDMVPLLRRPRPDDPWRPWLIGMNCPTFGVEDLLPDGFHSYMTSSSAAGGKIGQTGAVWSGFHRYVLYNSHVVGQAVTLFSAAGLLGQGDFQKAVDTIAAHKPGERSESVRSMGTLILLHAYFGLGDRQKVIELIADEGARGAAYRQALPVLPSLGHYAWSDYKGLPFSLLAPIALHLLWTANENDTTASLLRYATGAAIRQSGVKLPSQLTELAEGFPRHQLAYFLHKVCVPQILDVTRILKGSRDVLEERLAICNGLRNLDAQNASSHQDEIMAISNKLALDDGQWIVDRSRVHVDADALMRWASKEFSEDFSRYRDLLALNIGRSQNFDDVLKEIVMSPSSRRTSFTPENESDAVLASILSRCGDEFLFNPSFGFDFFLSKRIRHQSFIGLIRGPLEFAHLITTRESETGAYRRNDFWLDKFTCITGADKEALNNALAKFSAKFDETLVAAKDTSFHIRSPEHPNGLLHLELSSQLITLARAVIRPDSTLPDFLKIVLQILWATLEPSLANVRRFVSDELKTKIAHSFDELRASVRKFAEQDPVFLQLDPAIGGCSSDVQRALDDVVTWFYHADVEVQKRSFSLDQILNISIDSVLKCHRAFHPEINCEIEDDDCQMSGGDLVSVHDFIFIALDNVRIHSHLKKPKVEISITANTEDGTLIIKVISESNPQSQPGQEENLREIRQVINEGNMGRRTRNEGRSGILKLAAVVRQSSKGRIEFGFTDDNHFELSITYSLIVIERME